MSSAHDHPKQIIVCCINAQLSRQMPTELANMRSTLDLAYLENWLVWRSNFFSKPHKALQRTHRINFRKIPSQVSEITWIFENKTLNSESQILKQYTPSQSVKLNYTRPNTDHKSCNWRIKMTPDLENKIIRRIWDIEHTSNLDESKYSLIF